MVAQTEFFSSESDESQQTSFLSDFSPSEIDELPAETGEVDPIAEAKVYIEYGRFGQAEALIRQGLEREPNNPQLKLKLFEILSATKNVAAFTALAEKAKTEGLPQADPGTWESVVVMGAKLAPDNKLFASKPGATDSLQKGAGDELASLDDLDFGDLTDSLNLDFDSKQDSKGSVQKQSSAWDEEEPVLKSEIPESETPGVLEMEDLADELAAIQAAAGLDRAKSDQLEMQKLAEETVSKVELDDVDLDSFSLDLDQEASLALDENEPLNLQTEEVERLELPDMDEAVGNVPITKAADANEVSDEIDTKLDLAQAYLDVGDKEGARSILQEVVSEGSERQKQAAQKLISSLS